MKRTKKMLILLGILLLFTIAAVIAIRYDAKQEEVKSTGEIILNINPEEVTSLSWDYEGVTYAFHKEDHWIYDTDPAFPVNDASILEMLSYFQGLTASFTITDVKDYAQYGLTDPVATIQLAAGSQTYKVDLGTYSTMDSQRYLSLGNGKVYMTEKDPYDIFGVDLSHVIQYEDIPTLVNASSVSFSGDYNFTIRQETENSLSYSSDDEFYAEANGQKIALDTFDVNNYLTLAGSLPLLGFATYQADSEDVSVYGMDTPNLSLTFEYRADDTDRTFTLHLSENPVLAAQAEEESEEESSEKDTEAEDSGETEATIAEAYARIGDSPIIYEISGNYYQNLMNSTLDHFRHTEVFYADWNLVTQLDIVLEDNTYTFTTETAEEAIQWYYGNAEMDIEAVKAAVTELKADSFLAEEPELKEEIRFTAHIANETFPESTVALYRYDSDYCLAVIDGQPTSLVSRDAVIALIEAVYDIVL